jgi:uncharacterized Zn finger protein
MEMKMSSTQVEVKIECIACGPTNAVLPDDYTESSLAHCEKCGASLGTYGDIVKAAQEKVFASFADTFSTQIEQSVRGMKNVTFKRR